MEGVSDQVAVETLANRLGRDLTREGVAIVAIGGAQAIGRHLGLLGHGMRVAGLCDAGEERAFKRGLELAGGAQISTRADLERHGFFVCDADLEEELIHALGAERVLEVLENAGGLSSFRTFQKQPHWQGRPVEAQLRRHFGSSAGKIKYAGLLVEALDLTHIPRPLESLLAFVSVEEAAHET